MEESLKELICEQAKKIESDCDRASVRDSLVSTTWDKWNLRLGVSSALLAGAAAAVAQGGENIKILTSVLAICSAIIGSILTFLAPSEKASTYHKFSNNYFALRDKLRFFIAFQCASSDNVNALEEEFKKLLTEKQKIDADHPVVAEKYYEITVDIIARRKKRNKRMHDFDPSNKADVDPAETPASP
jgi:hypothetical protein